MAVKQSSRKRTSSSCGSTGKKIKKLLENEQESVFTRVIKGIGKGSFHTIFYFGIAYLVDFVWYSGLIPGVQASSDHVIFLITALCSAVLFTIFMDKYQMVIRLAATAVILAMLPIALSQKSIDSQENIKSSLITALINSIPIFAKLLLFRFLSYIFSAFASLGYSLFSF